MLAILLLLLPQSKPVTSRPFDKVIALEIDASDPLLEGHGHCERVEYAVEFSGTLHVWTGACPAIDPYLVIEDAAGARLGEDDNSGGRPAAYIRLAVEPGDKLRLRVASERELALGSCELHLVAAVETAETRTAAASTKNELAEIRVLVTKGEIAAARTRLEALIDQMNALDWSTKSELMNRQAAQASNLADDLAVPWRTRSRLARAALRHRQYTLPPDHIEIQQFRNLLAVCEKTVGSVAKAEKLEEQVLAAVTRTLDPGDEFVLVAKSNLARTYHQLGDARKAASMLTDVLSSIGSDRKDLQSVRDMARLSLALCLSDLGEIEKAAEIESTLIDSLSATRPEDDALLLDTLHNHANTLWNLGQGDRARLIQEHVLRVRLRSLPADDRDLQAARLSLASTLRAIGDVQRSQDLVREALGVLMRTTDQNHPDFVTAYAGLAANLSDSGDHAGAIEVLSDCIERSSRLEGAESDGVLTLKIHLGHSLVALGRCSEARALMQDVLGIALRVLHPEHPVIFDARRTLARAFRCDGRLQDAADTLEELLAMDSNRSSGEFGEFDCRQMLIDTLARQQLAIDRAQGGRASGGERVAASAPVATKFWQVAKEQSGKVARAAVAAICTASGRECESRCATLGSVELLANSSGLGVFAPDPEDERLAFLGVESVRGSSLAAAKFRRLVDASAENRAASDEIQTSSRELSRLAAAGAPASALQTARERREAAERRLAQLANTLGPKGAGALQLSLEPMLKSLGASSALVSYWRYERYSPATADVGRLRVEDSLCAFIVRPDRELTRVELGAFADIQSAMARWRAQWTAEDSSRGIAVASPERDLASDRAAGERLRALIVDPLLAHLTQVERVVILPDDELHLVPFEALPVSGQAPAGGAEVLGDLYAVQYRSSLWEFQLRSDFAVVPPTLTIVGNVDYSAPRGATEKSLPDLGSGPEAGAPKTTNHVTFSARADGPGAFAELPATVLEVSGLQELFESIHMAEGACNSLTRTKATKSELLRVGPKTRWLHIATHGWYAADVASLMKSSDHQHDPAQDTDEEVNREIQFRRSPMLQCGLALAGANAPDDKFGRQAGILNAEEISALDLRSCELAVLSACETGVGKVGWSGQGIASLQKALQMAGARSVITSLWKVPDEATKDLMLDFYRRLWVEKKPKWQALWEAKMLIRNAKDERGAPKYTTRDWAAWVLTGDPN